MKAEYKKMLVLLLEELDATDELLLMSVSCSRVEDTLKKHVISLLKDHIYDKRSEVEQVVREALKDDDKAAF